MNPEDARKELIAQLDRSKIFEPVHTQDFAVFYCSLASTCSENAAYEVITKFVEQVLELSESSVWCGHSKTNDLEWVRRLAL